MEAYPGLRLTEFDHQAPKALVLVRREHNNACKVVLVCQIFLFGKESHNCLDAILNRCNDIKDDWGKAVNR